MYRSYQNVTFYSCLILLFILPPNLLTLWSLYSSASSCRILPKGAELLSGPVGSDARASLKPLAEIPACSAGLCAQTALISCWLLLQLYSLFMCGELPIRQFYILGMRAKWWSKSLPTDHTTLNNFRSLITEEIIRRRKCVDLSLCLPSPKRGQEQ